jgi:membrane fusion protein, heavy metal efflux system
MTITQRHSARRPAFVHLLELRERVGGMVSSGAPAGQPALRPSPGVPWKGEALSIPRLLLTLALLAVFAGCDQTGGTTASKSADQDHDHAGHAHGVEGEKGDGRAEHDHDHDHDDDHADEVVLTPQAVRDNGIVVQRATRQALTATLSAPARVAYNAEQVAHVSAPVAGRVAEVKARVGDVVKAGDTLLVVDSPELGEAQSDYLQKRTGADTATSAEGIARAAHERARQLEKSQNITRTEVEKRLGDYQAAQGAARTAAAAAVSAANRLQLLGMTRQSVQALADSGEMDSRYAVTSPIAGRVVEREVTLGELVGPDRDHEHLVKLANLDPVWVLVDVPEAKLGAVAKGSEAKVELPALGQTVDGTVTHLPPELDESTRTGRVRVEVANPQGRLLPGMFARVELATGDAAEPVLAVPGDAVQSVEGKPAVFVPVEGESNTFSKREVDVGPAVGGMVPVRAGLKEGDEYVSRGSFLLKAELGKAGAQHEH